LRFNGNLELAFIIVKLHRNGKFFIINLCRIWGDTLDADIQDRIMTMKETKGDAEIFQKQTCQRRREECKLAIMHSNERKTIHAW
jgi:hypothetical protein